MLGFRLVRVQMCSGHCRYVTYSGGRKDGALGPAELRERRHALNLSQADLGRALGVTRHSVARWERGELPIRHPELVMLALDKLTQTFADGLRSQSHKTGGTARHNLDRKSVV